MEWKTEAQVENKVIYLAAGKVTTYHFMQAGKHCGNILILTERIDNKL